MGVPADLIRFHNAPYGGDYSSREAIQAAAIADGFSGFSSEKMLGGTPRGSMAYIWGTLQIIRKIAGGKEAYGYYNQDDFLLMRSHSVLCKTIEILSKDSLEQGQEFLFLQLWVMTGWPMLQRPWLSAEFPGCISSGVGGMGDSGVVMSRAGARYLLERFETHPSESQFCHLFHELRPDVKGAYSVSFDAEAHWIGGVPQHRHRWFVEHGGQDRVAIDAADWDWVAG